MEELVLEEPGGGVGDGERFVAAVPELDAGRPVGGRDAREALESGDLFRDLKKSLVERILDTEMDVHLEAEWEKGGANRRNGHNRKRVL